LTLERIYGILIMGRGVMKSHSGGTFRNSPIRQEAKGLKTRLVIVRAGVFVRAMDKPEGRR